MTTAVYAFKTSSSSGTGRGATSFKTSTFWSVSGSEVSPLLVGLFYVGCAPAVAAECVFPEDRRPLWATLLVAWTVLWLVLAGTGSV